MSRSHRVPACLQGESDDAAAGGEQQHRFGIGPGVRVFGCRTIS